MNSVLSHKILISFLPLDAIIYKKMVSYFGEVLSLNISWTCLNEDAALDDIFPYVIASTISN